MNRRKRYEHIDERAREVVRFDRFYARRMRDARKAASEIEVNEAQLGIFHELLFGTRTLSSLSWHLDLDPGYLSRTLRLMELTRHVTISESAEDRRERLVDLTDWGLAAARNLEWFHEERARKLLEELAPRHQRQLVEAMRAIVEILERDWVANLIERFRNPA